MKKISIQEYNQNFVDAWKKTDSMSSFLSKLHDIGEITPYNFSVLTLFSSTETKYVFKDGISFHSESKIEDERKDSNLYRLSTIIGKEKKEKIEGRAVIFREAPGIFFLFSLSPRDFLDKCVLRFIRNSYPRIVQPIIKQIELREILSKTDDRFSLPTIRIIKSSAKRWIIAEEPSGKKKQMGSRVDWEKGSIPIKDAFREAIEEGKWFTTLTFRVFLQRENILKETSWKGTIGNKGIFLTNMWLPQFSEVIIPSFISIVQKKLDLFKNRSRADTPSHIVRPLAIEYKETVFKDAKTNEEFISAMKMIPNFGYSVIHGNPYIHMSLLDYKDGSSFEILVHESNKIVIFPQIRASETSLEKVVGWISERFSEGEIVDLESIRQ